MNLANKTAIVTGATKGIGRACALALAESGANVVVNYLSDDMAAQSLEKEIMKFGVDCLVVKADISKPEEVSAMFKKIKEKFNNIDVLVNNAGIFDEKDSPENYAAQKKVFETNYFGQIDVTNNTTSMMKAGKIVFISSIHGNIGGGRPTAIAYSASKAAINSYAKNLAKALAPKILVNAVSPGRTLTPMWGEMTEEYKKQKAAGQLIERWIEPEEIADAVLFLVKNDAVCGEILVVDGGDK